MSERPEGLVRLETLLAGLDRVVVAVSGGVDSTTLAALAHRVLGSRARMAHGISPAVPPRATARVRRHAAAAGWSLEVLEAGEFADPRYRANPVNRCYFCKSNLYEALCSRYEGVVVAGTNLDDLGDYRPGLRAADERGVRHPYVEAGVDKAGVRAIARALGMRELSELPASPCLSSRIETGLAIDAEMLGAVDDVEQMVGEWLEPRTVRCRVRRKGIVVELDPESLAAMTELQRTELSTAIARRFSGAGAAAVDFAAYSMGSAFLGSGADV